MFKQWIFTSILIASSCVAGTYAAPAAPEGKTTVNITPFEAKLVNIDTTVPFPEVINRLDTAINKTGSLTFVPDFHAAKTKKEQQDLINSIVNGRNFLWFMETNHKAWLDVYDPETEHPGAVVYMIGNPNFAAQILPLEYTTGVNIPPRFLILEKKDKSGTNIIYQQPSSIFAPFNKNPELATHTNALDTNFAALFKEVTRVNEDDD